MRAIIYLKLLHSLLNSKLGLFPFDCSELSFIIRFSGAKELILLASSCHFVFFITNLLFINSLSDIKSSVNCLKFSELVFTAANVNCYLFYW